MIVNASSKRATRWSNGKPKARYSVSFQPAPRPRMKRPPLISSIGRGHPRDHDRRVEADRRDERADLDPLGDRRDRRELRPGFPGSARAVAGPIEVDGRPPRSSRGRSPPRPARSIGCRPSAARIRPRVAGPRPSGAWASWVAPSDRGRSPMVGEPGPVVRCGVVGSGRTTVRSVAVAWGRESEGPAGVAQEGSTPYPVVRTPRVRRWGVTKPSRRAIIRRRSNPRLLDHCTAPVHGDPLPRGPGSGTDRAHALIPVARLVPSSQPCHRVFLFPGLSPRARAPR